MLRFKQFLLKESEFNFEELGDESFSASLNAPPKQNSKKSSKEKGKPKEPPKPDLQFTAENPFGNENIRRLYAAVVSAENKRNIPKDPFGYDAQYWTRNRLSKKSITDPQHPQMPSTSYGPGQVTGDTVEKFYKVHPEYFKGNEKFVEQFIGQAKKFKEHNTLENNKIYHPTYGNGGVGDFADAKYNVNYQQMVAGIIYGKLKEKKIDYTKDELNDDDLKSFGLWYRGADEPEWMNVMSSTYKNTKKAPPKETKTQPPPTDKDEPSK